MATLVPEPKIKTHYLTNTWGGLLQMGTVLEHPRCMVITTKGDLPLTQLWPSQNTMG